MSYIMRAFCLEDMHRNTREAWGDFGGAVVERWIEFNAAYFGGALRPIPIVITNTQPFGRLVAFCSYGNFGRTITLNVPKAPHPGYTYELLADNNVLLHEMVHQFLVERGEYSSHDGDPWRREIMRLTKILTGQTIWAGRSKTMRQGHKVVRRNVPHPETGEESLPQAIIARWPNDGLGINLGRLGC